MDILIINLFLIFYAANAEAEKQCSLEISLKNGKVKFQLRGGITAVFSCDDGYLLRGSNVSHCQTDGHWSAFPPTCEPNDERCSYSNIETFHIQQGRSITVRCSRKASIEDSHLFWTTNGTLVNSTTIDYDTIAMTTKTLGTYICLMYTSKEVILIRSVNIVKLKETQLQLTNKKCDFPSKNIPTTTLSVVDSDISLPCTIASPLDKITWFKDGKTISDDKGFYSSLTLNISAVQKAHEGNYTCMVHVDTPLCPKVQTTIVKILKVPQLSFNCGQTVMKARRWRRVIDGSRATPLSAPWMGMLATNTEQPFCGCSLISNRWVLTAAHCFKTKNKDSNLMTQEEIYKNVRVKLGKQQRQAERGEVIRYIAGVVIHPNYKSISNRENFAKEHDIALVKLSELVIFQPNILPICLPSPGFMESVPTGTLGVITGWGQVSVQDSVMALTLQEAYLPVVNNSSCQQSTNYAITDNMLCAGYAESYRPDTCSGDSGGPFVLQKQNLWFLAGVVSWGEGCSSPKKFGIYTRVENYVPWIRTVLTGEV